MHLQVAPGWRNWQTQRTQNPPGFGPWGFDSPSRHQRLTVVSVAYGSHEGLLRLAFPCENAHCNNTVGKLRCLKLSATLFVIPPALRTVPSPPPSGRSWRASELTGSLVLVHQRFPEVGSACFPKARLCSAI